MSGYIDPSLRGDIYAISVISPRGRSPKGEDLERNRVSLPILARTILARMVERSSSRGASCTRGSPAPFHGAAGS
jgi:hypothetical protein